MNLNQIEFARLFSFYFDVVGVVILQMKFQQVSGYLVNHQAVQFAIFREER